MRSSGIGQIRAAVTSDGGSEHHDFPRAIRHLLRTLPDMAVALSRGLATAAAYQPFGVWPLGAAGLLVGLWTLRRAPGWRSGAALGMAFGVGLFGGLFVWSLRFGVLAYATLVATQAMFPAVAGALAASRTRSRGVWMLVVAGAWTLAEAARARWPLGGFEWGQFAHAAADLPVRVIATVIGSLGLTGALVALAAAAVVATEPGSLRARLRPLAATLAALTSLVGLGGLPWTQPTVEVTVAIVQADPACPGRSLADCPEQRGSYLQQFTEVSTALPGNPDLLLWGEGALASRTPADAGAEVLRRTGGLPAPLLAGVTTPVGPGHFYNRNVLYDAGGRVLDSYAKRHPVPFGEYVPARSLFGGIGDAGRLVPRDMIPGSGPGWLTTPVGPVGTVSSWELSFARHVRTAAAGGSAVVTLTTQSTYEREAVSDQLLAIARVRAAELGKPMVVAATTGRSALIPAGGASGTTTRLYAVDDLFGEVTLTEGRTPFAATGEAPAVLVAAMVVLVSHFGIRRSGRLPGASRRAR
jgi:apolipoprotein N-acyltransferase